MTDAPPTLRPGPPAATEPSGPFGAMVRVSAKVAAGGAPSEVLGTIVAAAVDSVPRALGSCIVLRLPGPTWRYATSHGLSARFDAELASSSLRRSISAQAVKQRSALAVDDTDRDPRFAPFVALARSEGFRSMVSTPMGHGRDWLGALNVYRTGSGPWSAADLALLKVFAEHAASALTTSRLLDAQASQVVALRHLVTTLEAQGHEHANRLQAVTGLLALGAPDEALELLRTLANTHHASRASIERHVDHPLLHGFLEAKTGIARQREIQLELDLSTDVRPDSLPVSDAQLITIVGNLLDNAFDAVGEQPRERRVVRFRADSDHHHTTIEVTDHGGGVPADELDRLSDYGHTTKPEHRGIGLTLVADAVTAAGGALRFRPRRDGLTVSVRIPNR